MSKQHDKKAILNFLAHLAGELRQQEFVLDGRPLSPRLRTMVNHFRQTFDVELLSDIDSLFFLANDPDEDGNPDGDRDAARQALVERRRKQVRQVMGVASLLEELEI